MKNINFLLLGLILISCKQTNQDIRETVVLFEDQIIEGGGGRYKIMETLQYDIDKDNVLDTIKIYKLTEWEDPGDFHKIEIKLSSNTTYEVYNSGDWIAFENEELKKTPNKVDSENILITEMAHNQELLIIKGYSYASSPGKLTILNLYNGKVKPIFQDEFHIVSIADINKDDRMDIVGWKYYSELLGYNDSISEGKGYRPYHVLKTSIDTIEIDTVSSEEYNLENYVGFFGLAYDTDSRYLIIQPDETKDNVPDFKPYFYFEKYREYPEVSLKFLTTQDLDSYSKKELRMIRNEILAFHGHTFSSKDVNDYFKKFDWYKISKNLDIERRLNKYERANIKMIKKLESIE